jgi:hypothetical protein
VIYGLKRHTVLVSPPHLYLNKNQRTFVESNYVNFTERIFMITLNYLIASLFWIVGIYILALRVSNVKIVDTNICWRFHASAGIFAHPWPRPGHPINFWVGGRSTLND